MKPRDDLFALIHALDKNEKRYLALCARGGQLKNGGKFLALMAAIGAQAEYDEAAIKAQFAAEPWIAQLSAEKSRLLDFILESLAAYHPPSPSEQVQQTLRHARLLRAKGLYTLCERLLDKAAALSLAHDAHLETLALQEERRILIKEHHHKGRREGLARAWAHSQAALATLNQETALRQLRDQLFHLGRQEFVLRGAVGRQEVAAWMAQPFVQADATLLSFEAKFLFYAIHAIYHQLLGEPDKAHQWFKANKELWEGQPRRIQSRPLTYLGMMANYLHSCCLVGAYQEIPPAIVQLSRLQPRNWNEEAELFQNSHYYLLLYHMNAVALDAALALVPAIEAGLAKYGAKVNQARLLGFHYNIAMAYFIAEDFRLARAWFQRIADAPESENRQDIRQTARIFLLLCHWELGHLDLLEHAYRAAFRHLQRRDRLRDLERLLFHHLYRLMQAPDAAERKAGFLAMQAALLDLQAAETAKLPPGFQEIGYWLGSRIAGQPIAAQVRAALLPPTPSALTP